jgi:nicotinate phosphoribosyltransferase
MAPFIEGARVNADVPSSLLVDLYELTMADAYRLEGLDTEAATFSLFVRELPRNRAYVVAAGVEDALSWLEHLQFGDADLDAVESLGLFDSVFLDWLSEVRFEGTVRAVQEGTIVFAGEPIIEVDAPLAIGQLAESYLSNQVLLQSTLATKASRLLHAASGRPVIDFALRRCQGVDAAMKLARVGRLVGLAGTSNVAGAVTYDLPASGTMAHSYVQAHDTEREAMEAFASRYGKDAVLLVDTYDSHRGIEQAVSVAAEMQRRGRPVGGVRLDSGDLAALSRKARRLLDDAGLRGVKILASGGLDEHQIDRLLRVEKAPIDGFGVGSALGVSADAPGLDTVYKLVAVGGRPVRKTSARKETLPGAKQVWRAADWSRDVISLREEPAPGAGYSSLLEVVMSGGERTQAGRQGLDEAAENFERHWKAMPEALKDLESPASYPVALSGELERLTAELDRRIAAQVLQREVGR